MSIREADLHMHTTASDGLHTPQEVVRLAVRAGLAAIAITDHDTVAGAAAAAAEGAKHGLTVVTGVEISTALAAMDIHVLGYYVDERDEQLKERLAWLRGVRESRNEDILRKLGQLGMSVTMEDVRKAMDRPLQPEESVGRPHIAAALVHTGYVRSIQDAFDRWLGSGKPAFVQPERISPEVAAKWIREAGGAAVLAHPGLYKRDEDVLALVHTGLFAGIEVYHSDHTPEQERRYAEFAADAGLIATGGSDFHGIREGDSWHGSIGSRRVPLHVLEALRETCISNRKGGTADDS